MDSEILQWVATTLGAVLTGALLLLSRWVASKTSVSLLQDAATRLGLACRTAVAEVQQTYVDALKEASADGKLTAEERKAAKDKALVTAKALLGVKGLRLLAKAFGLVNGGLESMLASSIEATVAELPPGPGPRVDPSQPPPSQPA